MQCNKGFCDCWHFWVSEYLSRQGTLRLSHKSERMARREHPALTVVLQGRMVAPVVQAVMRRLPRIRLPTQATSLMQRVAKGAAAARAAVADSQAVRAAAAAQRVRPEMQLLRRPPRLRGSLQMLRPKPTAQLVAKVVKAAVHPTAHLARAEPRPKAATRPPVLRSRTALQALFLVLSRERPAAREERAVPAVVAPVQPPARA